MGTAFGRRFEPKNDIIKLQQFLSEMRNLVSQAGYFHLGDLIFRIYKHSNNFDLNKDIRIWEDSGRINGFVLYLQTENNPEFQIRPELYETTITNEMITWTIDRAKELGLKNIEVSCLDKDVLKHRFLIKNGFTKFDDPFVCMEMDHIKIPKYELPKEYSFATISELPQLTRITGDENSNEEYKRMLLSNKYKDDLGIRVCYRNREIVSGCICWYDDIDNCGLFEPVGTKQEHRRKGLAFAVMAKTLENLTRYGADKVYIHTGKDNISAIKLYEKLGFRITNLDHGYELQVL